MSDNQDLYEPISILALEMQAKRHFEQYLTAKMKLEFGVALSFEEYIDGQAELGCFDYSLDELELLGDTLIEIHPCSQYPRYSTCSGINENNAKTLAQLLHFLRLPKKEFVSALNHTGRTPFSVSALEDCAIIPETSYIKGPVIGLNEIKEFITQLDHMAQETSVFNFFYTANVPLRKLLLRERHQNSPNIKMSGGVIAAECNQTGRVAIQKISGEIEIPANTRFCVGDEAVSTKSKLDKVKVTEADIAQPPNPLSKTDFLRHFSKKKPKTGIVVRLNDNDIEHSLNHAIWQRRIAEILRNRGYENIAHDADDIADINYPWKDSLERITRLVRILI